MRCDSMRFDAMRCDATQVRGAERVRAQARLWLRAWRGAVAEMRPGRFGAALLALPEDDGDWPALEAFLRHVHDVAPPPNALWVLHPEGAFTHTLRTPADGERIPLQALSPYDREVFPACRIRSIGELRFPSYAHSLRGCLLRVTAMDWPPYAILERGQYVDGLDVKFMRTVASYLGARLEFLLPGNVSWETGAAMVSEGAAEVSVGAYMFGQSLDDGDWEFVDRYWSEGARVRRVHVCAEIWGCLLRVAERGDMAVAIDRSVAEWFLVRGRRGGGRFEWLEAPLGAFHVTQVAGRRGPLRPVVDRVGAALLETGVFARWWWNVTRGGGGGRAGAAEDSRPRPLRVGHVQGAFFLLGLGLAAAALALCAEAALPRRRRCAATLLRRMNCGLHIRTPENTTLAKRDVVK
ncbi:Protein of unknown function [Gryllus bimaculatus]|nr:Protein of unknown function [Gryllus bimaculatus]